MRLVFDIDGTICNNSNGGYDTDKCQPYQEMINMVNRFYDEGHYIIFHTARGMGFGDHIPGKAFTKWYAHTFNQLKGWGVKFNELHLGKILGDVYIDDRGFRINADGSSVKELEEFLRGDVNPEDKDA